jgi:hypothetical protein
VIIRENDEVNDQPEEVVLDHLHATAFQGHSLGYSILGPLENIRTISQADLREYISTNYTAPRIVLAAAGGIEHEEVVDIAEKYFGHLSGEHNAQDMTPAGFVGSEIRARNDALPHLHVGLAVEGCGWTNPDYFPLMVRFSSSSALGPSSTPYTCTQSPPTCIPWLWRSIVIRLTEGRARPLADDGAVSSGCVDACRKLGPVVHRWCQHVVEACTAVRRVRPGDQVPIVPHCVL